MITDAGDILGIITFIEGTEIPSFVGLGVEPWVDVVLANGVGYCNVVVVGVFEGINGVLSGEICVTVWAGVCVGICVSV